MGVIILALSLAIFSGTTPRVNAATIGSSLISQTQDKTVYESSFQNFGFYAQGLHWVFFEDTSVNCENMGGCLFYATSTDGVSFSTPVNIGIHVTDSDWSVVTNSTHVFYVRYDENYFDSFCNRPLLFGYGVLISAGTISWQPEQTVRSAGPQLGFPNTVIRVDSNNQVWIGYQEHSMESCGGTGVQTPHVIHSSGTLYMFWTGDTTLSTAHSNNWDIDLAALPGGQVYAAYWINALDIHGALFNGTAWGPDEQISSPSESTDVNSFIFASGNTVYGVWYNSNTQMLRFGTRTSTGLWSTSNIDHGEAPSAESLNRYSLPITATFDSSTSQFFIYWFNTNSGVIDQWSGIGSNWTKTPGVFTTAQESGEFTVSSYYQSASVGSGRAFGVMWVDHASSPYNLNFGLVTETPTRQTSVGKYFDHVVVVLMENQGVADICGANPPPCSPSSGAPYMAQLANSYAFGTQYVSLVHYSYPNYIALLGADTFGCTNDLCPSVFAPNLVDRFESAGLTWKGYIENQQSPSGCDTAAHAPYAPQHNPFTAFNDIVNNPARCFNLVLANPSGCPVTDCPLINDLNSSSAPNFMWLTPNMCNDMHGASGICPVSIPAGDSYLSSLVPNILNSRAFTTQRSVLLIVFDEGNGYCTLNGSSEDCVYMTWAGPVAKNNFASSNFYDHYSLTRTIEDNWNLPAITSNDASAIPMSEFFANNPALPPSSMTVALSYGPTSDQSGLALSFSASVAGGTPPYSYSWNFGDSGTASGSQVSHTYQAPGPYDFIVRVTDSQNQTGWASRTVRVTGQPSSSPLTSSLSFTPVEPDIGQQVSFAASASGGTAPYAFSWTFGDGQGGSGTPVTHTFSSSGSYAVTLVVTDANRTTSVSSQTITVAPQLSVSINASPASPDAGQQVSFVGSGSGGVAPYTFSWDFGDSGTGGGSTASHTYQAAGTYTVSLTLTDANGYSANLSTNTVVKPPLTATFTYSPSNPAPLLPVTFNAVATGGTQPYSYNWDFGDGSTATGASATHSYLLPGTYSVSLAVTDANGQSFVTSETVTVTVPIVGPLVGL